MLAENVNCQIKKLRVQKNQFLKDSFFMLLTIQDDANKSDYEYVLKGVGKASTVLKLTLKLYNGSSIMIRKSIMPVNNRSTETYRFHRIIEQ